MRKIIIFILLSLSTYYSQNFWDVNELDEFSGTFVSIIVDANDYVYIASNGGGIIRSTNNGDNWLIMNDGLDDKGILSITLDKKNDLYVCTRSGLFRSQDNGITWTRLGSQSFIARAHSSLAINNSGHIFVLDDISILRSTDEGNNWTQIFWDANLQFRTMKVNSLGHLFLATGHGMLRSTNNGNSWNEINNGIGKIALNSLAISSNDNVYVGTSGGGIFRSTNNGNSWVQSNNGLTNLSVLTLNANSDNILAGIFSAGIFRSTDNGENWENINSSFYYVRGLETDSQNNIYAIGDGFSVFRSNDNGKNWDELINPLNNSTVRSIIEDSNKHIIAGTINGIFKSTNSGKTWKKISYLSSWALALHPNGNIFLTDGGLVYRSIDNGDNWTQYTIGSTFSASTSYIAIDSYGNIFVGLSDEGVYFSSNLGENWEARNNGLTSKNINCLEIFEDNIFVTTSEGENYKSIDIGNNWLKFDPGLSNDMINTLTFNSSGGVFAGTAEGKILQSTDNGESWIIKNKNSKLGFIYTVLLNNNIELFVATNDGVFVSQDLGENWSPLGLTEKGITKLFIGSNGYLFAGGYGVYRSLDIVSTVETKNSSLKSKYFVSQNYPNPFNPSTKIKYSIPNYGMVQIKIYNIVGEEINTLVKQYQQAGTYEVEFNGNGFTSGIYYYRIISGEFRITKKMLLLK